MSPIVFSFPSDRRERPDTTLSLTTTTPSNRTDVSAPSYTNWTWRTLSSLVSCPPSLSVGPSSESGVRISHESPMTLYSRTGVEKRHWNPSSEVESLTVKGVPMFPLLLSSKSSCGTSYLFHSKYFGDRGTNHHLLRESHLSHRWSFVGSRFSILWRKYPPQNGYWVTR